MAALAFGPGMATNGRWSPAPSRPELPVSRAGESASGSGTGTAIRTCIGTAIDARGGARSRGPRGPAPSCRFRNILLRPSGLLRVVCSHAALAATAILFVLMPSSVTARAAARGAVGPATQAGAGESSPNTALTRECTSSPLADPWDAGLSWRRCGIRQPLFKNSLRQDRRVREAEVMTDWPAVVGGGAAASKWRPSAGAISLTGEGGLGMRRQQ